MTKPKNPRRQVKRFWTPEEDALLRAMYPDTPTKDVAEKLRRSIGQVYKHAAHLGLHKSDAYLASPHACRLRRGDNVGAQFRFKKGQIPKNKGLRRPGWGPGRMKETQFRKGERRGVAELNYCPLGTIRKDAEGYQRIKVRDARPGEHTGFGNVKVWPLLNRHVWEQHRGPIPAGHIVVFKDRNRDNCDIENLELITFAENMRRNTLHRYPKEIALAIQAVGALNRQINKRRKSDGTQEQDAGSSQPSL